MPTSPTPSVVLPFAATRLSLHRRALVLSATWLLPDQRAEFEAHVRERRLEALKGQPVPTYIVKPSAAGGRGHLPAAARRKCRDIT